MARLPWAGHAEVRRPQSRHPPRRKPTHATVRGSRGRSPPRSPSRASTGDPGARSSACSCRHAVATINERTHARLPEPLHFQERGADAVLPYFPFEQELFAMRLGVRALRPGEPLIEVEEPHYAEELALKQS